MKKRCRHKWIKISILPRPVVDLTPGALNWAMHSEFYVEYIPAEACQKCHKIRVRT